MTKDTLSTIPKRKPRTAKDIRAYLSGHFRYSTMNSWNNSTSYAHCVKLNVLDWPDDASRDRAYTLVAHGVEAAFSDVKAVLRAFSARWGYQYQIGFNGRSGGYLVLYKGVREDSGYKSECDVCGQYNYQTVEQSGHNRCGYCHEDARVNLTEPVYTISTYPGQSIDMGERFNDRDEWTMRVLRERMALVWDFDQTCKQAVEVFQRYVLTHKPKLITVMVAEERMVAEKISDAQS